MDRGDINTIVTKALEKDRDRRYQTAAELAADIRRHLAHQPVAARPVSTESDYQTPPPVSPQTHAIATSAALCSANQIVMNRA